MQAVKYHPGELEIVTRTERLKQVQNDKSELFENLMKDWIDTRKNSWEPATFKKEVQSIEKHLLPIFGKRKFKEIKSSEWLEFFQTKQREEKIFNRIEKLIW